MKQMHFSPDEWQAFKKKTLEPELTAELEAHLQNCEDCQEYYLGLINEADLDDAAEMIPVDFTDSLLKKIGPSAPASVSVKIRPGKRKLDRRSLLAYYVTAAGLTLVLMGGGVFDSMVVKSMRVSELCMLQSQNIESKVSRDWTTQLMENGSRMMKEISIERERNVKNAK